MSKQYDHHWQKGLGKPGDRMEIPSEREKMRKARRKKNKAKGPAQGQPKAAMPRVASSHSNGWRGPGYPLPGWVSSELASKVNAVIERVRKAKERVQETEPEAVWILGKWRTVPKNRRVQDSAEYANVLRQRDDHDGAMRLEAYVSAVDERERATRSLQWVQGEVSRSRKATAHRATQAARSAPVLNAIDAQAAADEAARQATELAAVCKPILNAYGASEPKKWTQGELRSLVKTLRQEDSPHEAMAVERYADARIAWSKAIDATKRPASPNGDAPDPAARWRSKWVGRPGGAKAAETSAPFEAKPAL